LGPDKEICSGETLLLTPGVYPSYLWQDSSTQAQFLVKGSGLYSVLVGNSCGTVGDEVLVMEKTCDIYFPSAFTPNRDGQNELFKVAHPFGIKAYSLKVFNRWGRMVFFTTDAAKGWDGKHAGTEQASGVFVWIASGISPSGKTFSTKGTLMLIR
jgi:gliding motility-associated-like protein